MSYEKVKNIKINEKENKIMLVSACNNCFPLKYSEWEFGNFTENFDTKMKKLIENIASNSLQLQANLYKWKYAIAKADIDFNNKYNMSLFDTQKYRCNVYYTENEPKHYYDNARIKIDKSIIDNDIAENGIDLQYLETYKNSNSYYLKSEMALDRARQDKSLNDYYSMFMLYFNENIKGKFDIISKIHGSIKINDRTIVKSKSRELDYKKAYCELLKCTKSNIDNLNISIEQV